MILTGGGGADSMWSDMKSTKIVKFTNHKKVRFWKGDLS